MNTVQFFVVFGAGFAVAWVLSRWMMEQFYSQYTKGGPEDRKDGAVTWMEQNGEITNDKYQELYKVSDAQATRDLDDLEKQGKVEQIGATSSGVTYKLRK